MDISITTIQNTNVVAITGDIDGSTAPQAQEQILPLMGPGAKLVLDMRGVSFMSSGGLRLLLVVHHTITGKGGRVVLVGLSEELRDTMSMTGFLSFFTCCDTLDEGVAALV